MRSLAAATRGQKKPAPQAAAEGNQE
jgi:hypothetical protein